MDKKTYLENKLKFEKNKTKTRNLCVVCLQPEFSCYCCHIQTFDPGVKFVILIHPIEQKRRIATGRMSHLILQNSELILGQNYSDNLRINDLINDPDNQCFVLYPGVQSVNISTDLGKFSALRDPAKKTVIFVVDGTWASARKMMRQSLNLKGLPRFCFTPITPSQFKVRKQPSDNCYSTIEAIHHTLDLLQIEFNLNSSEHDKLLYVFKKMVDRQLFFIQEAFDNPRSTSYRRPKMRIA